MSDMKRDGDATGLAAWARRNLALILQVVTLSSVVGSALLWVDSRYAKAEKIAQVERRLDVKITNDFLQNTQSRIWQMEDRLKQKPDDTTAQEELRRLTEEKKKLERQLDSLERPSR